MCTFYMISMHTCHADTVSRLESNIHVFLCLGFAPVNRVTTGVSSPGCNRWMTRLMPCKKHWDRRPEWQTICIFAMLKTSITHT